MSYTPTRRIELDERPYYPRDAETLLAEVFYKLQAPERGRLMAEHPGAYQRWCNYQNDTWPRIAVYHEEVT